MRGVLFIDPVATRPYDDLTLRCDGLGGTEATVVRVAGHLARLRMVAVAQKARRTPRLGNDGVLYVPWDFHRGVDAMRDVEAVVVLRARKVLRKVRQHHPSSRLFLWMHCFAGKRLKDLGARALDNGASIVAVSEHHASRLREHVARYEAAAAERVRIPVIHNPIEDELAPDGCQVDPDKLFFASSPHKGLDQVLETFAAVRRAVPSVRLHLANPGYLERRLDGDLSAVVSHGTMPHREVIRHLRESLCLFYPQTRFAETFGLVFAEANAVGTPVITHPIGAAEEVVHGPREQLVDATDPEAVVERILRWRAGERPTVCCRAELRLREVGRRWEALLWGSAAAEARDTEERWRLTG